MPGKNFKVSKHFILLNFSVKNIYCLSDLENVAVLFKPPPCLKGTVTKLHNNKYMIALTQITNTEFFGFITVLVYNIFSSNVLFINRKCNRNCKKIYNNNKIFI